MELAEAAEAGGVRGDAEPALGRQGGADEGGGGVHAKEDLAQKVVVAQHLGRRLGAHHLHSSPRDTGALLYVCARIFHCV